MELITGSISKCPISGGNWNNNTNAGVWNLNWNNNRTNSNNYVGGRLDYGFTSKPIRAKWSCRDIVSGFKRNLITLFFLVGNCPTTRREAII